MLVVDVPHKPGWTDATFLRERLHWDGTALHIGGDPQALAALRREIGWRWEYPLLGFLAGTGVLVLSWRQWRKGRPSRSGET